MTIKALPNAVAVWNDPVELDTMLREWDDSESKRRHELLVVDWVGKVISIADLGCGSGRYATILRRDEYYGYDSSAGMLSAVCIAPYFAGGRTEFASADIFEFSSDRHYDVAIMIDVAQHQECPVRAIERIIELWSANRYIVSLLVGNELEELYNSIIVPFSDLFDITNKYKVPRMYVDNGGPEKFAWVLMEIAK